jgi:CheY-like chemotaxis protein
VNLVSSPATHSKSVQSKSVLIVDDSPIDRLILDNLMTNQGWRAINAACGEDAIRCLERATPDLILMDIVMPGMGGIEAIKKIRRMLRRSLGADYPGLWSGRGFRPDGRAFSWCR